LLPPSASKKARWQRPPSSTTAPACKLRSWRLENEGSACALPSAISPNTAMGWMTSDWAKRGEFWVPLVAVCTFLPSLCGGFVFDDLRLIVDNAYVQSPAFATRAFSTHFWDVSGAAPSVDTLRYYRPLVTSS